MGLRDVMEAKLAAAFSPEALAVLDESHHHAGHRPNGPGHAPVTGDGETHFRVRIVAPAFSGMSRLERHRAINAALKEELAGGVHALAIEASAPGEAATR
ncbi:BolA family protein [Consotaella salsifontis]|uniref:BolA protein n=1 Tax=Consotaella salsifontis TaxID=1365950 RepID=A0A1T4QMU6_9HYPH|nr:BolA family protein [Consotaella salsifontis]SKA05082.1 BolA protein [Consotaella salsifontis]